MLGVKPCPYCGGEVEVIKLDKRKEEKRQPYRIQCYKCHALVARGEGFPCETLSDAEDRIADYNRFIEEHFAPIGNKIRMSRANQARDRQAAFGSRTSYDDEVFDMHDAGHRNGCRAKRGTSAYDT